MKKNSILNAVERKRGKVVNIDELRKKISDYINSELSSYSLIARRKLIPYIEYSSFENMLRTNLLEKDFSDIFQIIFNTMNELDNKDYDEIYYQDSIVILWTILESLMDNVWDKLDEILAYSNEISYATDYMQNYYAGEVGYDDLGYENYDIDSLKKAIDDLYRYLIEQNIKKNKKK